MLLSYFIEDNSGENITYWLKPSVKDDGVKLTLGEHSFSYLAADSLQNKAKCTFIVSVLDITPPTIDNCIDPLEFYVPIASNASDNRSYIDWDSPTIYDNSEIEVTVQQSIMPGALSVGRHAVTYTAIDSSGNRNTCTINLTVNAMKCDLLAPPLNGQVLCAQNVSHTWCDVTCDIGYTIYHIDLVDPFRMVCDNNIPQWPHDPLPDCTRIELPESIEQMVTISLDDDMDLCQNRNDSSTALMKDVMVAHIKRQLCDKSIDSNCQILSELPSCDTIGRDRNDYNYVIDHEFSDRNFYRISKREAIRSTAAPKKHLNFKFRVYTRISKGLGLWNSSLSRVENMDIVKKELKSYHTNEKLRNRLHELRINVKHLNLAENLLCKNGSVLKKNACGNFELKNQLFLCVGICSHLTYTGFSKFYVQGERSITER